MKKNALKRIGAVLLAVFLLIASLPVALAAPTSVDYDVVVTASDNYGVNLREGPATSYAKVRKAPSPCRPGSISIRRTPAPPAENGAIPVTPKTAPPGRAGSQ